MPIEKLKTTSIDHEIAPRTELSSAEYVNSALWSHDVIDKEGIKRPAFVINNHEIVFRTTQEAPEYEDADVIVPGGKYVYPIEREVSDKETQEKTTTDESAVRDYVDSHQDGASRIVVTNTPEGMLSSAAILADSAEDRKRLQELAEAFAAGDTWTESQKEVIDIMLAATNVDDQGKLNYELNMDGWPLALAALSGDVMARLIVDTKREALINAERERASDPKRAERDSAEKTEKGFNESEPIPLEQLALVHSTKYDIQRDDDGDIILRTAGQHGSVPRASLHFTLNSMVGDVYGNSTKMEWSDDNKLIVANFKGVVDESHTLPNRMAGMDTWFMLNPGEALKLPGALVVERVGETTNGKLIEETENGILFVIKDEYSNEEQDFLLELTKKYGVSNPRDIALRMAMERVGVPVELMDSPSSDGHGMFTREMDARVNATAMSLGLPSGKHFDTPEANLESKAYLHLNTAKTLGKFAISPYLMKSDYMTSQSDAAIEARRQTLANGLYPARVDMNVEESLDDSNFF